MGKRLIHQRRGRGTPAHRVASHRFKDKIQYRAYDDLEKEGSLKGKVVEIIHEKVKLQKSFTTLQELLLLLQLNSKMVKKDIFQLQKVFKLMMILNVVFQHQSVSVTLYHLLKSLKVLQFTILKTDQETEVVS